LSHHLLCTISLATIPQKAGHHHTITDETVGVRRVQEVLGSVGISQGNRESCHQIIEGGNLKNLIEYLFIKVEGEGAVRGGHRAYMQILLRNDLFGQISEI